MLSTLRQGIGRKITAFSKPPQTAFATAQVPEASELQDNTSKQKDTNTSTTQSQNKLFGKKNNDPQSAQKPRKKTISELDEELRQKMSGLSGDGGDAGVEYEDGQPVSMKRSVKNNMFRYI